MKQHCPWREHQGVQLPASQCGVCACACDVLHRRRYGGRKHQGLLLPAAQCSVCVCAYVRRSTAGGMVAENIKVCSNLTPMWCVCVCVCIWACACTHLPTSLTSFSVCDVSVSVLVEDDEAAFETVDEAALHHDYHLHPFPHLQGGWGSA